MKIAMCFNGKIGGISTQKENSLSWQDPRVFRTSLEKYKENIIDCNKDDTIDVFIHCWDSEHKDELINKLNPVSYLFEDSPHYYGHKIAPHVKGPNGKKFSIYNKWLSVKKTLNLMNDHSTVNNIKYDFVILCRFDVSFLEPLVFSDLNKDKFYVTNWHQYFANENSHQINDKFACSPNWRATEGHKYIYKKVGYPVDDTGFMDLWFLSSQEKMLLLSKVYDNLNELARDKQSNDHCGNFSNHKHFKIYLEQHDIINDLEYILDFPITCCHTRYLL